MDSEAGALMDVASHAARFLGINLANDEKACVDEENEAAAVAAMRAGPHQRQRRLRLKRVRNEIYPRNP